MNFKKNNGYSLEDPKIYSLKKSFDGLNIPKNVNAQLQL